MTHTANTQQSHSQIHIKQSKRNSDAEHTSRLFTQQSQGIMCLLRRHGPFLAFEQMIDACRLSGEDSVCLHVICLCIAPLKIHLASSTSFPTFHFLHNRIHRSRHMSYSIQTMGDPQHPPGGNKESEANRTF